MAIKLGGAGQGLAEGINNVARNYFALEDLKMRKGLYNYAMQEHQRKADLESELKNEVSSYQADIKNLQPANIPVGTQGEQPVENAGTVRQLGGHGRLQDFGVHIPQFGSSAPITTEQIPLRPDKSATTGEDEGEVLAFGWPPMANLSPYEVPNISSDLPPGVEAGLNQAATSNTEPAFQTAGSYQASQTALSNGTALTPSRRLGGRLPTQQSTAQVSSVARSSMPNQPLLERRAQLMSNIGTIYMKYGQIDKAMELRKYELDNIFKLAQIAPMAAMKAWNSSPQIVEQYGALSPGDLKEQGEFKYLSFGKNKTGLIGWNSKTGRPVTIVPPKNESEEKAPTIPFIIEKPISANMQQKLQWNPETKTHDIPVGKPHPIYKPEKPEKPESPYKRTNEELTAKGKIENLIGQQLNKEFGKTVYDPILQQFETPSGIDHGEVIQRYDALKQSYYNKYGLPIGEQDLSKPQLKPITKAIESQIRAKVRTREEAEQMARDMGYDPTVRAGR
jgi:hypothetical protein